MLAIKSHGVDCDPNLKARIADAAAAASFDGRGANYDILPISWTPGEGLIYEKRTFSRKRVFCRHYFNTFGYAYKTNSCKVSFQYFP